MQTQLAPHFQNTAQGQLGESILRKCVHCGFCTATCPTYQLLGDELDGPRGRIYLIKEVLEGKTPTQKTQAHLDRCLTCRNCESTCPSGVDYGHLLDVGREVVEQAVPRSLGQRSIRWLLKHALTSSLFKPAYKTAQLVRPLLPSALKGKITPSQNPGHWPQTLHPKKALLLEGCVQDAMMPNVNTATARVLDAISIQTIVAAKAQCCGALAHHLNDHELATHQMKANIDAWWPWIEQGVAYIVMNASGCGVMVKDYGHLLRNDPLYADKAKKVSEMTLDISEVVSLEVVQIKPLLEPSVLAQFGQAVFHPPCTLQHGQKIKGSVEGLLTQLGFTLSSPPQEAHLCCGSAGTYSVLQPQLSNELKARKLLHLNNTQSSAILSANVGCISHLQSASAVPVSHWIEWLDQGIQRSAASLAGKASHA